MTETIENAQLSDSPPFHIRMATAEDAENLVDYLKSILTDRMASMADIEEMTLDQHRQREYLRRTEANPDALAIIAEHAREIIGYLSMEPRRRRKLKHTVELGMSVREDWRHHGVGTALVEFAYAWARSTGAFEKITLNVFSQNTAAIRLYEKEGFVIEGRLIRQIKIDGAYQDLILMAKFVDIYPESPDN